MTDNLESLFYYRHPTQDRPLLGLTILIVDDSRFASEALRLMAQRSGARLRRADCMRTAQRHLQTYRPGAVMVDIGLPDGDGCDLIRMIRAMPHPHPFLVAMSGDPMCAADAMDAGADDFMDKQLGTLHLFQRLLIDALPERTHVTLPMADDHVPIKPDMVAFRDDLNEAARLLAAPQESIQTGYLSQFLSGIARLARDDGLERAARDLHPSSADASTFGRAAQIVQMRLHSTAALI